MPLHHNQELPTTVDPRELQRPNSQVDTRQPPIDLVRHVAKGGNSYASSSVFDFDDPDFDPNTFNPEEHKQFLTSITDGTSTTGPTMDLTTGFETPAPAQQDTSENTLRDSFLTKLVVERNDALKSKLTMDTRKIALAKEYRKATPETRNGYIHLHKWVTSLKDCATYSNYTYEEAVQAYNEIEKAYNGGTYNETVKARCKTLELPFAFDHPDNGP
jgi:hypothetical protein